MSNEKPEAIELADHFDNWATTFGEHPSGSRSRGATELRRQHARIQELEEFASAISQYGVLIRAGGAAPHDLKDLSAALAQCVELAKGVLK